MKYSLFRNVVIGLGCGIALSVQAETWQVPQTFELKAGWNAVWVGVDVTDKTVDELFGALPVTSVSCYRSEDRVVHETYATDPAGEMLPAQPYAIWTPGDPTSTLKTITADDIYLINATEKCSLTLTGKPRPRRMQWLDASRGVNFFGVATEQTAGVSPIVYLAGFPNFNGRIYQIGGTGEAPTLIKPLTNVTKVRNGDVLLVEGAEVSSWNGDFRVQPASEIAFGDTAETASITVENMTERAQTITLTHRDAKNGTGERSLKLYYRETRIDAWQAIDPATPISKKLEANETWTIYLGIDRTVLGNTQELLCDVLAFTSSNASGYTELLPISALDASLVASGWPNGIWLIQGELDAVSRVLPEGQTEVLRAPPMPITLILRVDTPESASAPVYQLLQHITIGQKDGEMIIYAPQAEIPPGLDAVSRLSSVLIPVDTPEVALAGDLEKTLQGTWAVKPNSPSNPFYHPYHPDHDGKTRDFKDAAPSGDELSNYAGIIKPELWTISNDVTFTWAPQEVTWQTADELSGTLTWKMGNLFAVDSKFGTITTTGTFTAKRIYSDFTYEKKN